MDRVNKKWAILKDEYSDDRLDPGMELELYEILELLNQETQREVIQ